MQLNVNYLIHSALVGIVPYYGLPATLKALKVAYNRIFRILMGMYHRAKMFEDLI